MANDIVITFTLGLNYTDSVKHFKNMKEFF